jgi:Tol biopolymer transport system component
VKVLDFGLAKAYETDGSDPNASHSPTLTAWGTQMGVILGTAAYMSPEQARAKPVDKRADIWALGVVMFEMLSGRRVFGGETASEVLASVMKDEPEWSSLPASTPPRLRRLLRWCLRKNPRERLQDAGDVRILLDEALDNGAESTERSTPPADGSWTRVAAVVAVSLLAGGGLTWMAMHRDAAPTTRTSAAAWDARPLTATGDAWNVALSPDGQVVAYLTTEGLVTQDVQGGSPNLVLRDNAWQLAARTTGTPGRRRGEPQWLHDGSGVAFAVDIDARTLGISSVPRMGGDVITRLAHSFTGGEAFASFQSLPGSSYLLARVLESREAAPWIRWVEGGSETGIDVPPEIDDLWDAVAAPDGRFIAYVGERADRTNVVGTISRDGNHKQVIAEGGAELSKWSEMSTNGQWPLNRIMRWPSGRHVYYRQASSRGVDIYAATIDPGSGAAVAEPQLVYSGLPPGSTFDVALDGRRLVYSGGPIKTQIRVYRFDTARGGKPAEERVITRGTARHVAPRFSPDGRQLAYVRKTGRSEDIYVAPATGGEARRVDALFRWSQVIDLKWSPDGGEIAAFVVTAGGPKIVIVSLADARVREVVTRPPRGTWFAWSPDGRRIAYGSRGDEIYVVNELGPGKEHEHFGELRGEKIQGLFSPDGASLLVNNIGFEQSGLWVQGLDEGAPRRVTEVAFGTTYPVLWSPDGMLYLLSPEGAILAVPASGGTPRELGRMPERPIWEGWASATLDGKSLSLACAVDDPRESDVWLLDRSDSPAPPR